MSNELALDLLQQRINLLERVEISEVGAEVALILEYIEAHPVLRNSFNSLKEENGSSTHGRITRQFNEIQKGLVEIICQVLIRYRETIERLNHEGQLNNLLQEINIDLFPNIEKYELGVEIIEQLREILGPASEINSAPPNQYSHIVNKIFRIGILNFRQICSNRDRCIYLRNIYNQYTEIKNNIRNITLNSNQRAIFGPIFGGIKHSITVCYRIFGCDWELPAEDQTITELTIEDHYEEDHLDRWLEITLQNLSEFYFFVNSEGVLNTHNQNYIQLKPLYSRIQNVNIGSTIANLEEMAYSHARPRVGFHAEAVLMIKPKAILLLSKLIVALKEQIVLPKANYTILKRFQEKAQNFERKRFYKIAHESRDKEKELTMILCGCLHDNNKKPYYDPKLGYPGFSGRRPDVVDLSTSDALIIEVKVITRDRNRILLGFGQAYDYVTTIGEKTGYYVIFNAYENKKIDLPTEIIFQNEVTIFNLIIDITKDPPSGELPETISFSELDLKGIIDPSKVLKFLIEQSPNDFLISEISGNVNLSETKVGDCLEYLIQIDRVKVNVISDNIKKYSYNPEIEDLS